MAKYDTIDFTPPQGVRDEAAKGLEWRKEYGRGGTAVGVARARDLKNGKKISPETARRMKAYFDRHEVDKKGKGFFPGDEGFPSAGRIAWALWGSDPGYSWSKKLVRQMNAEDERNEPMTDRVERRSIYEQQAEQADTLLTVETRKEGDTEQRWITGYAAKFGVDSLDMGEFTERIAPGAFSIVSERRGRSSPLETRALWNHDANFPLARYPGTLRLTVDEVGLRYEFPVPNTSYGVDLANTIEAGIVRGSSFSFVVAKGGESWQNIDGKSVRMIEKISELYDVGPVTYPAYPDATAGVARRSYENYVARTEDKADRNRERLQAATSSVKKFLESRGYEDRR